MKISVLIPSCNQVDGLAATLESVCAQPDPEKEILVFDAGSTDGSQELLESYGERLRWTAGNDHGPTDAINQGLARARGAIFLALRPGEISYPGALATAAAHFSAHPGCLALYGDAHHLGTDGGVLAPFHTEPWDYARLLTLPFLPAPAVFWRRELAERYGVFDERLHYAADYDYWLRAGRETPFAHLKGCFLAGSPRWAEAATPDQRIVRDHEILRVVQRHATAPEPVLRSLLRVAHSSAAAVIPVEGQAGRAARRGFVHLYAAVALRYARELDIELDETTLTTLDARMTEVGL